MGTLWEGDGGRRRYRTAVRSRRGQQGGQQQAQPGAAFRVPGAGARPRRVEEVGPAAFAATITLKSGAQTPAGFQKFQTLDIDQAFLLELDFSTTFTTGTGAALTQSQIAPVNWLALIQVQFESAYSTFRLPGWLAAVMQSYRSVYNPTNLTGQFVGGANIIPPNSYNANGATGWYPTTNPLGVTPNFAFTTAGVQQTYSLFFEIPVSMYFDLYWELGATGQPLGMPIPRCIVSPQRMAASTRNVAPNVLFNQPIGVADAYDSPVSTTAITSQTFAGSVNAEWWREAWIPTDNMLTEPPGRLWQYTRDYIYFQPAGAAQPIIPLDNQVPGQGQILSLVFATWDPALNSGAGGFTPYSAYNTVELLLGSSVQLYQDTVKSNIWQWFLKHGAPLPQGVLGWDLALGYDGKLTNEQAINTLVQNGAQLRITWNTGNIPGNNATVYVGLEVLKKVGS